IKLYGGCILDDNNIILLSRDGDLEYGDKHIEINLWRDDGEKASFDSITIKISVEAFVRYKNDVEDFDGVCLLSSESEIYFVQKNGFFREKINNSHEVNINKLSVIDGTLYGCGDDGVVCKRIKKNKWMFIDEGLRNGISSHDIVCKMIEYQENRYLRDGIDSVTATLEWLNNEQFKYTDMRCLWDIKGTGDNTIYVCGSVNTPKSKNGVIFHYDGNKWDSINIPETGTLSSIFIDHDGSIIMGGLEGHLLVSKDGCSFYERSKSTDLMSINCISKHDGVFYFGTSEGLFQYKENLVRPDIQNAILATDPDIIVDDLLIDISGDYMLLVGTYSVCRYCFLTGKCEQLLKFTGRGDKEINDE
ncbi:hypothetical protein JJQ14_21625, partial [Enterobacter cloacae]|nr:hypothetical protein [Enterobacter cloacae]